VSHVKSSAYSTQFALSLAICVLVAAASQSDAEDWSQWRGPNRTGLVAQKQDWPASLDEETLKTSWRVSLASGYSGPIVTSERVFVTETRDKKYEVVRALKRKTGKEIWSTEWEGAMTVPFFAAANGSWIRSTPTLDNGELFVAGIRDVLVCLAADSGKIKWRVDFAQLLKTSLPSFGCVCSPLVDGDHVYVQAGGGFIKLKRDTGDIVWRTLDDGGGMLGSAFSSPIIGELAGTRQAIVQTRKRLAGVDLETGSELWSVDVEAFRGMNILTPTLIGDRVFTSSYGGGSFLFEITKNGDGSFKARQQWRNKVQGYMSSPVVINGHIYLHLKNQRFACINVESGKETWITQPFGKYWSLIANDDQILALDERGELLLIHANPKAFELIERRRVSDQPTWAHVGLSENDIFIRELQALVLLEWRHAEQK
jgi:outer membrane protein assembly factor BamB